MSEGTAERDHTSSSPHPPVRYLLSGGGSPIKGFFELPIQIQIIVRA